MQWPNASTGGLKAALTQWRFGRNLAVLTSSEVVVRGLTFLAFVHLARVLEPATYGLVELTLAVMMFLFLTVDQGLGTLGAREVARDSGREEWLIARIVPTQLALAGGILVATVGVTSLLPLDPTLVWLLVGYAVSLLGIPFFLNWVFQGRQQMVWVAVPQTVRWLVFAGIVLLVIRSPEDVRVLPLGEIAAVASAGGLAIWLHRRSGGVLKLKFRGGFDRRLIAESLPIGGSQMIWALRMYLPTILLGLLAGQVAVGFFGVAHRFAMVFQALLTVYFVNLFPTLSQTVHSSPDELPALLRRSLWFVCTCAVVLALATLWGAPLAIGMVFGEQYLEGDTVAVLRILIWIIPILAWRRHSYSTLVALNRQRDELACTLAGVTFLLGLVAWWTPLYGGVGTAWAMVVSEVAAASLTWWRLKRYCPALRMIRAPWSTGKGIAARPQS